MDFPPGIGILFQGVLKVVKVFKFYALMLILKVV